MSYILICNSHKLLIMDFSTSESNNRQDRRWTTRGTMKRKVFRGTKKELRLHLEGKNAMKTRWLYNQLPTSEQPSWRPATSYPDE